MTRNPKAADSMTECPICEYPNARAHYRMTDRFFNTSDDEFLLYRCSSCGLVFQEEEAIKDRLADYYPAGYWWQEGGRLSSLETAYREWMVRQDHLRFLLSCLGDQKGRLLDIGCGSGTFVKVARRAGLDACGLEISERAAALAEKNVPGHIFQGTHKDLIEQGERFEALTLFHCLEHLTNPFRYLKELQRLLDRPGKLIIQVPNVASLQARILGRRWYGLDCPRHIYNFSTFSLLHLLGRAGYRIQRVRHFSLRDNGAALVSSIFPVLDPMSQRVRMLRKRNRLDSAGLHLKQSLYLLLFLLAQPLAAAEAALGRGATITVYATID